MATVTRRAFCGIAISAGALAALGCSSSSNDALDDAGDDASASGGVIADSIVGEIGTWAVNCAASGWLPCDGAEYEITDYPALFTVIQYAYGGTVGSTFRVPDLSGRALVGTSSSLPLGANTSSIAPATGGSAPAFSYNSVRFAIYAGNC